MRLALLWLGGCAALAAVRKAGTVIIKWLVRLLPTCICLALLLYWIELATQARLITLITGLQAVMQARFPTPQEQETFRLIYGFGAISRGAGLLALFVWPAMALLHDPVSGQGQMAGWRLWVLRFLQRYFHCRCRRRRWRYWLGLWPISGPGYAPQRAPRLMAALTIVLIGVDAADFVSCVAARSAWESRSIRCPAPGSTGWKSGILPREKIAVKPLLGWGFDASRNIDGGQTQFVLEQPDGTRGDLSRHRSAAAASA